LVVSFAIYFFSVFLVWINALIAALICSGRFGQCSTTIAKSGSFGVWGVFGALSVPDSVPRFSEIGFFDGSNGGCSSPPRPISPSSQAVRFYFASPDFAQPLDLVKVQFGFIAACSVPGIKQIFASYNNPKGNADTERVMRTIKEDLVWPNDFESPFDLQPALDKWVNDYNTDFPHSSIGYKTPCEFEQIELSKIP
jgi:hypothetical protein